MKLQLWRDRRHRDGAVRKMRLAHSWTKDLGRVEARQLLERGDGALDLAGVRAAARREEWRDFAGAAEV